MYNESFIVYCGQGLTQKDFQRLLGTKGGLLSFNNFLSTHKARDVAMLFVQSLRYENEEIVGVLFSIIIDQSVNLASTSPFAFIADYSCFQDEEEILFSMHTVFREVDIKLITNNTSLYEVQLIATSDTDPQLSALTDRTRKEISGEGRYRIGELVLKMGYSDPAMEVFQ
ncbi:unnamed protein product, partial [Rotaria magnacalcarata]